MPYTWLLVTINRQICKQKKKLNISILELIIKWFEFFLVTFQLSLQNINGILQEIVEKQYKKYKTFQDIEFKLYTLSKKQTLFCRTFLYSCYKGLPPSPLDIEEPNDGTLKLHISDYFRSVVLQPLLL